MRGREEERGRAKAEDLLMDGVFESEHVRLPVDVQHVIEGAHRLPVNPEHTFAQCK